MTLSSTPISDPWQSQAALQSAFQVEVPTLRQHLLTLLSQLAYQEGNFMLSSGQPCTCYINGKQVTLHPYGAIAVGRVLLSHLSEEAQGIAGLTLGADPIVTAISLTAAHAGRSLAPLIIRKEAKGHGTRAYIEGLALPLGCTIAVVEDVVTTGQSALKAVNRLQAAGYTVNQVLALVDREQGGPALYQSAGLDFQAIFSIRDIQTAWRQQSLASAPISARVDR